MRKILLSIALLVFSTQAYAQNYQATQGAGTTFGTKLVGGVNFPQFVVCDPTTPAQCAAVDASGRLSLIPNTAMNIAQINGVTPLMGNGATGTGSLRITIANDNTIPTGWPTAANQTAASAARGEGATGAAVPSGAQYCGMNVGGNLTGCVGIASGADATSNATAQMIHGAFGYMYNGTTWDRMRGTVSGGLLVNVSNTLAAVGNNADDVAAGAGAASPVVSYNYVWDGTNWDRQRPSSAVLNPCETVAQSYAPISITSATTTRIVTPSASNKTYICGLIIVTGAANNVAIVEGTGGTCGTGTAGVIGGTTAANGSNFSANGGLVLQAGKTAHAQTAGTNVDLCVITSSAGPYSGGIKYVQAP